MSTPSSVMIACSLRSLRATGWRCQPSRASASARSGNGSHYPRATRCGCVAPATRCIPDTLQPRCAASLIAPDASTLVACAGTTTTSADDDVERLWVLRTERVELGLGHAHPLPFFTCRTWRADDHR